MELRKPYALFLGDAPDRLAAKVAIGVAEWRPEQCVGQVRLPDCRARLDLPDMSIEEAAEAGAQTLVIGVANRGGVIPSSWHRTLSDAVTLGLDIASGLHTPLSIIPGLLQAADRRGIALHEVRQPNGPFMVANGKPRSGRRLLTIGTDCSVGKMYAALAIERELANRGVPTTFRATGQTGILIEGSGIPVDAVVADFISGAVEQLCPAAPKDHWDLIEGQGSLHHPSFSGVSLGLLHGAQPTDLVLCHEPTRTHMRGLPNQPLPSLKRCIDTNLTAGQVTSPHVRFVGVAVNTSALDADKAKNELDRISSETGLPAVDPVRHGVAPIVDQMLA
ncbi:MAG: N-acetyltransferase DgcN [Woeseia sp.]